MYMIPVGLNLAYRDLCLNTPFNKDILISEWMKPFKDFKWLITLTMFGAVVYAVFPPNIWGATVGSRAAAHWVIFIPYTGIAIVLVSAVLLPHHFFHKLFSNMKHSVLEGLQKELSQSTTEKDKNILKRILLLLEKGEIEKLKAWLLDVKTLGEIVVVVLLHVGLVEVISVLIHD